ncbi:DNA adenine methylase [Bacteroides acidifaciens]|uniref:DNA adenine methylase n=1 Tax=Bacteroides acidifaciens TaxID=85831 RepID=UPI0025581705|nr:DNA adenine methylase [Bacteroides acidifaciens]
MTKTKAKPFLKWAGGKTQLLPTIDSFLPDTFSGEDDVTYIEPFVGGGAMLFYMLQKYSNIKRAVINDINPHLIKTYTVIRDEPYLLIDALNELQTTFNDLEEYDKQKELYLEIRNRFNQQLLTDVDEASYMIFLNRTCFNGLYRENSKGGFNVPFGRYSNPTICDGELILADSELLQKVEILNGDFSHTAEFVQGYTFFYFDPPYRPLDATSSFNSYVKESFDDNEQIRLKDFYSDLTSCGCYAMLSNSDCKGRNAEDDFFDRLYEDFFIERVYAKRSINANASKRGTLTELLIRNYENYQGELANLFNI